MRVRIKATPKEREIDGIPLNHLHPGQVRDVSPLIGSWLIAEEYAESEMRLTESSDNELNGIGVAHQPDRRRRRS